MLKFGSSHPFNFQSIDLSVGIIYSLRLNLGIFVIHSDAQSLHPFIGKSEQSSILIHNTYFASNISDFEVAV